MLVSQNHPLVERFSRQDDTWFLSDAQGLASSIALPSIDCTLGLAEGYANLTLEED